MAKRFYQVVITFNESSVLQRIAEYRIEQKRKGFPLAFNAFVRRAVVAYLDQLGY